MATAIVAQIVAAIHVSVPTILVVAFLLGVATQGAKIAFDTIIQQDTPDDYRGRAFVLYDMLFNTAFMTAGLLGVVFLPDTGLNQPLYAVLTLGYLAIAFVYRKPRNI